MNIIASIWYAEDIIAAAKENNIDITEAQAAAWMDKNEEGFKELMAAAGNEILETMTSDTDWSEYEEEMA